MTAAEKILAAIGYGADAAVPSRELQAITGLNERELRKLIETLRRQGHVIISCNSGYFFPETLEEVQTFINKESHRARSVFYTLKSARKLAKQMEESEGSV